MPARTRIVAAFALLALVTSLATAQPPKKDAPKMFPQATVDKWMDAGVLIYWTDGVVDRGALRRYPLDKKTQPKAGWIPALYFRGWEPKMTSGLPVPPGAFAINLQNN